MYKDQGYDVQVLERSTYLEDPGLASDWEHRVSGRWTHSTATTRSSILSHSSHLPEQTQVERHPSEERQNVDAMRLCLAKVLGMPKYLPATLVQPHFSHFQRSVPRHRYWVRGHRY